LHGTIALPPLFILSKLDIRLYYPAFQVDYSHLWK